MFNITLKYGIGKIKPVEDGYEVAVTKTFYCSVCGAEHERVVAYRHISKEQYEEIDKKYKEEIEL